MSSITRLSLVGLAVVAALGATPALAAAQGEPYVELLRQDLRTNKVAILTEAMALSEQQGQTFWPIYRQYELELSKLMDARIALIKDFAASYQAMSPEKARDLADRWFKQQDEQLDLLKSYTGKVDKAIGPIMAVRFAQIENRIAMLIDLQIAVELPLVK